MKHLRDTDLEDNLEEAKKNILNNLGVRSTISRKRMLKIITLLNNSDILGYSAEFYRNTVNEKINAWSRNNFIINLKPDNVENETLRNVNKLAPIGYKDTSISVAINMKLFSAINATIKK